MQPTQKAEWAARRKAFLKALGTDNIAVLFSAPEALRNGDSHYLYRQDSDFLYLTNFSEPDAIAVFIPGRAEGEFILFNRPNNPDAERWDGARAGQKGAVDGYGADQSFPIDDFLQTFLPLASGRAHIFYPIGRYSHWDGVLAKAVLSLKQKNRSGKTVPNLANIESLLHEQRLFKTPYEIERMRRVGEISGGAHAQVMQMCKPGLFEYALEAELLRAFYAGGCAATAYSSIVASGPNSCTLHYVQNSRQIQDGDVVLIDAGGEFEGYAADITRTFPANGRFSARQAEIYDLVLAAQLAAIDAVKPGNTWEQVQTAALYVLVDGLIDLKLLSGTREEICKSNAYQRFFMHGIGHWLGLDVHDAGQYKHDDAWRPFEPGMVITVEPGLYLSPDPDLAEPWWNIGVRIEDDVLVTSHGHEVLTAAAPKDRSEIEQWMQAGS